MIVTDIFYGLVLITLSPVGMLCMAFLLICWITGPKKQIEYNEYE